MTDGGAAVRRGLLVPAVAAILVVAGLLALGTWQVERKAWKESLIAMLDHRLAEPAVALPPRSEWAGMSQDNSEFTRVKVRVTFFAVPDAMVYTPNSAMRDDVKSPGYMVFVPVRLPDGSQIVLDRGFVPDRSYSQGEGSQEIVGVIRWPEPSSRWIADYDASDASIWYVRNPRLMAEVKNWGEVPPFYIEQDSPVPPGGLPHPAPLRVQLRNEHLQYAITWYGLAAVVTVMFVIWAVQRRRTRASNAAAQSGAG